MKYICFSPAWGRSPVVASRRRRKTAPLAAAALFLALSACRSVDFYEMEAFSDPVMAMGEDPTEVHLHQKVFYSMEGSAGGIGSSAGGGCGCY